MTTGSSSARQDGLTVLIITNRSTDTLLGAIHSVNAQDFTGPLHVVIVGDDPEWNPSDLPKRLTTGGPIDSFSVRSSESFRTLPTVERVARLRNASLAFVREAYLCFLDDDNRWLSNHVRTLMTAVRDEKALAAHSWRQLVDENGAPWNADRFPWGHDTSRSCKLYKHFVSAGVITPKSSVFRDVLGIKIGSEIIDAVDIGAWIFNKRVFNSLRFETAYTPWEITNSITEDDKLVAAIRRNGMAVACTKEPTLIYQLGGYSNRKAAVKRCQ